MIILSVPYGDPYVLSIGWKSFFRAAVLDKDIVFVHQIKCQLV